MSDQPYPPVPGQGPQGTPPGAPQPGYGTPPPGYAPPPGYGPPPGAPPGYGPPPGAPPGYGPPPGAPPGYGPPPGAPPQGYGAPPPYVPPGPRRSRKVWLIPLVVVLLLVLGGGAVAAWRFIQGGGDSLADNVPADANLYVHVNLNPSAANKLGARGLVDRINEAAGETLLDLDSVVEMLSEPIGEGGGSFATDIDPWLGNELALYVGDLGGLISSSAELEESPPPPLALLAAIDDPAAARAYVSSLGVEGDHTTASGATGFVVEDATDPRERVVVAFTDDLLAIGNVPAVDAITATEGGLAASDDYSELVGRLPDRIITFFTNGTAIGEDLTAVDPTFSGLAEGFGQTAVGISITDGAIRISAAYPPDTLPPEGPAVLELADQPAGGFAYLRLPNLGETIARLVETVDTQAREMGEEPPSTDIDAGLQELAGTNLAAVTGWLGDVVVSGGYDPDQPTGNVAFTLTVGTGDEQATRDLIAPLLRDLVPGSEQTADGWRVGGIEITVREGQLQVRTPAATAAAGSPVGETEAWDATFGDLSGDPLVYVDLRAIAEALARNADDVADSGNTTPEDVRQGLAILGAFDTLAVANEPGFGELVITFSSPLEPLPTQPGNPPDLSDLEGMG